MSSTPTPKPKGGCFRKILIVVGGLVAISLVINLLVPKPKAGSPEEKAIREADSLSVIEKRRTQELNNAGHIATAYLKKNLKDPDSYEEIEMRKNFIIQDSTSKKKIPYIQVNLTYRSKNSFGGYVIEKRYFNFDKDLSLYESEEFE